jgi:hypothetical protein
MSEAAALIVDHHSIRYQSSVKKTIGSIDRELAANMSVASAANLRT